MKTIMLPWKSPTEGCEPPAGVKSYLSRTFANAVTASTNLQSISNRIRTRSQEKLTTRLFTLQSPFLVPILKTVSAVSRSVRSLSRARTWKGAIASVAVSTIPLAGCYNLLMLNVGSAAHEAAAVGKPLSPEVECAALAQTKVEGPIANIDAMQTCLDAVQMQKKLNKEKHK